MSTCLKKTGFQVLFNNKLFKFNNAKLQFDSHRRNELTQKPILHENHDSHRLPVTRCLTCNLP